MDLGELHSIVAEMRRLELKLLDGISGLEWQESGYRHLWQLLRDGLRISAAEAKRRVAQAELLCPTMAFTGQPIPERLPAARAAMAEGAISTDHVARIVEVMEAVPAEHADQVDRDMTELAREFHPAALRKLGDGIVQALDPDGPEPADPSVVEAQNTLDLKVREDGSVRGTFMLGVETAGHLMPLLSSLTQPRPGDARTLPERQGDALAEVIGLAANAGEAPIEGGERPHIAVTVSLDALRAGIGRATLDDGHTLTPEQARRLACDAGIIPIVLGGKSQPIDVGESKRLADKRLRRALAHRDKGCAVPGCGRPPSQCHAHHVQHWADGGPTILANMVLVCPFHHRLIHHAGWHVRMDKGMPVFTPPSWLRPAA